MHAAGLTDIGNSRAQNQDSIYVSTAPLGPLPNLFIVADGMGGHNAGEVASQKAVEGVIDYIQNFQAAAFVTPDNYLDLLTAAVQEANTKITQIAMDDKTKQGMGTTLTACVVTDEKIYITHIGDSRAYTITPRTINQITTDHTYVAQMLQAGEITQDEALMHPNRHMITRVLGAQGLFEADGIVRPAKTVHSVLLCSDGLSNALNDETLKEIVRRKTPAEDRVKTLVNEANLRDGRDNISAIIIDLK